MNSIIGGVGAALVLAFLCFMLKEIGFGGARLLSVLGVCGLLLLATAGIGSLVDMLGERFSSLGIGEFLRTVLKIIGVGYVFGICSDICRDMGEGGIATAVLVVGRVEILLMTMPYILRIIDIAEEMLG